MGKRLLATFLPALVAPWVPPFGGAVKGGRVYGRWPGLAAEQLYEGRDLALTTDFRDVLEELVARHMANPSLDAVFPGYRPRLLGLV